MSSLVRTSSHVFAPLLFLASKSKRRSDARSSNYLHTLMGRKIAMNRWKMRAAFWQSLLLILSLMRNARAFVAGESQRSRVASIYRSSLLFMTADTEQRRMGDLTTPEQAVYDMMQEISGSGFAFRVVVVGKGAILETTNLLGPVIKVTQSPSTGKSCEISCDQVS